jgi:hypothetical protein
VRRRRTPKIRRKMNAFSMKTAPLHVAADSISDKMKAVHTLTHNLPQTGGAVGASFPVLLIAGEERK